VLCVVALGRLAATAALPRGSKLGQKASTMSNVLGRMSSVEYRWVSPSSSRVHSRRAWAAPPATHHLLAITAASVSATVSKRPTWRPMLMPVPLPAPAQAPARGPA
jgi:hypothetical protein